MLSQRLAVAAVGLPIIGLLIWLPERAFAAALTILLALAVYEMMRALATDLPRSLALSAAVATALFVALARNTPALPLWSFLSIAAVALALILRPDSRLSKSLGGWWMTAVLYVGVLGAHLVLLRNLPDGQQWLLVLVAATFATDTGAYAVGRLFGRRPFMPRVSPRKTWEGAVGGYATGAAAGVGATLLLGLSLDAPSLALLGLVLPPAAIAGDLLESALKRQMDVKDMSTLLPGHGGLLDRLDSVLVVGACLYWIVRWLQT